MARAVAPGEVIGVDYSEGMLAEARERARHAGRLRQLPPRAGRGVHRAGRVRHLRRGLDALRACLPRLAERAPGHGAAGDARGARRACSRASPAASRSSWSCTTSSASRPSPPGSSSSTRGATWAQTWRIYRQLKETFGDPSFITVPDSLAPRGRAPARGRPGHRRHLDRDGPHLVRLRPRRGRTGCTPRAT